ncbi:hypothetical protein LEP1GSC041_4389 [Leptospira noguchii str. 2006001870]|nr:hypothetical protein LEP1GSC041_4389 [Leptospira noguchii str. 2006001870]
MLVPTFSEYICKIWICVSSHIFRFYELLGKSVSKLALNGCFVLIGNTLD